MTTKVEVEKRSIDIVCLGSALIELIGSGDTLEQVDTFQRSVGGATVNVAAAAVRLGRAAGLIARVGDDAFGRHIRAEARRLQIRDDWLQVDPVEPTTVAFLARAGGKPDFLSVRAADRQLILTDHTRELIRSAAALHTTTFALATDPIRSTTIEAIELAHGAGRIVSLDPNFRARNWPEAELLMPLLTHLLPLTTIIKPSLADAEAIWGPGLTPGDYIERFHAHGARQVLLTLGREGVIVSDGRTVQRLPAIPIASADTAGVGDAFTAGALAALIDRLDLVTAARIGMTVASYRLRVADRAAPLPAWSLIRDEARAAEEPPTRRRPL